MARRHTPSFRQIAGLLDGPPIVQLWRRHQQNLEVGNYVRGRLPSFLSEHCCGCSARDDQLIVFTSSATAATTLRFALPPLLPELQTRFALSLRRAEVRVLRDYRTARSKRKIRPPGGSAIHDLQQAAACCDSPELRSALLRLAETCRRLARGPSVS